MNRFVPGPDDDCLTGKPRLLSVTAGGEEGLSPFPTAPGRNDSFTRDVMVACTPRRPVPTTEQWAEAHWVKSPTSKMTSLNI